MDEKRRKLLKKKAHDDGCKTVDDYLLQCELTQIIGKLQKSFDRAVILPAPPDLWDVYLAMRAQEASEQNKRGKKKKKF